MLVNIVVLLVLAVVTVLFGWLVTRAWKARRWYVKVPGLLLAGLLTLVFALVTGLGAKGLVQMYMPYPVPQAQVTVAGTPEQVARGEHIASVLCASCHTQNGQLPLSGGNNLSADSGLPLGDIYPPNITPAGKIASFSDSDIYRILYTGIEPSGRLSFMNFVNTRHMSEEDALAVIAYLRHGQSVDGTRPTVSFSYLAALFVGAGLINPDVPGTIQPPAPVARGATKEYGEYMVNFMDCHGCHGPTLSGDAPPPSPRAANLTLIVPNWTRDDFISAIRTGVDKTGHQIQAPMPWKSIAMLDDTELAAIYEYLHGLAPVVHK